MNVFDKIVETISPVAGVRRRVARTVLNFGYGDHGASYQKKSLKGWQVSSGSADEDIVDNVETLRGRSRDMFMGNPTAAGVLKTINTNVVGPGLKLNANIDYEFLGLTPEQADEWESNVEREFALWADTQNCDAGRTNTFGQLQALAFLSQLMSGDSFTLMPVEPRDGSIYDLRIHIIEADRVCTPYNKVESSTIKGGIEVGKYGEPLAYYIANKHPNSKNFVTLEWNKVQAFGKITGRRNVIHLMEQERPEQKRGVPILAPVIEPLKQLDRYTEAELMAAVISGMFTVFIESQNPESPPNFGIPQTQQMPSDTAQDGDYELGNGAIVALGPGEKMNAANPGRPNTAFDGFVTAILRQIGSALQIPYELLVLHFTSSYSASRAALLEAWKMFRTKRQWLAQNWCQPIYEMWLTEAVAKGRVYAPGFFDDQAIRAAYCRCDWNGPSQGQLNPLDEAKAAKVRVEEGFSTRAKETAELTGLNYDDIVNVRIREEAERREGGLLPLPAQKTQGGGKQNGAEGEE